MGMIFCTTLARIRSILSSVMRRLLNTILCSLLLTGCQSSEDLASKSWFQPSAKVKVLATTEIIGDLVKRVGGDQVDVLVLIRGELDPHSYQLVKGDDEKIRFADLIFYNGLGLEHGPSIHGALKNSPNAVALGDEIQKRHPERILYDQGQVDPHLWMDVSLWAEAVPVVRESLEKKTRGSFHQREAATKQELMGLHQWMKSEMEQLHPCLRYLVTSHDAFNYFARTYLADRGETEAEWRKRFKAPEGLAPESQISLSHIQEILSHLLNNEITVLFPESNISQDSIKKLVNAASENGLEVTIADSPLYGDAMGSPGSGAETYQGMMKHNVQTITRNLQHTNPTACRTER